MTAGTIPAALSAPPDRIRIASGWLLRSERRTQPFPPLKKNPSNLTTNQDGSHHDICHVIVVAVVAVVAVVVDVFLLLCFLFLLILLGWIFIF